MGRGKLSMELITKEHTRSTTYNKRKKGLIKKASEFSTLCDVDTCMIIYGPKLKGETPQVEVWPNNRGEVSRIINKYKEKFELGQGKTVKLLDFFLRRIKKVNDDISKLRKANIKAKYPRWDDRLNNFSLDQIKSLISVFDANLDVLKMTIMLIKGEGNLMDNPNSGFNIGGSNYTQSWLSTSDLHTQTLFQKNMELEVINYNKQELQPLSSVKPLDMQIPQYHLSDHHRALQILPVDHLNPINNQMMMMLNGGHDFSQFCGAASSSNNIPYTVFNKVPVCYDPTMCFYGPSMQPLPLPYSQHSMVPTVSSQMQGPKFRDFYYDINKQHDQKNTKERF